MREWLAALWVVLSGKTAPIPAEWEWKPGHYCKPEEK